MSLFEKANLRLIRHGRTMAKGSGDSANMERTGRMNEHKDPRAPP